MSSKSYKDFDLNWREDEPELAVFVPVPDDSNAGLCTVCNRKITLKHMGKQALKAHLSTKKHQERKKRQAHNSTFPNSTLDRRVSSNSSASPYTSTTTDPTNGKSLSYVSGQNASSDPTTGKNMPYDSRQTGYGSASTFTNPATGKSKTYVSEQTDSFASTSTGLTTGWSQQRVFTPARPSNLDRDRIYFEGETNIQEPDHQRNVPDIPEREAEQNKDLSSASSRNYFRPCGSPSNVSSHGLYESPVIPDLPPVDVNEGLEELSDINKLTSGQLQTYIKEGLFEIVRAVTLLRNAKFDNEEEFENFLDWICLNIHDQFQFVTDSNGKSSSAYTGETGTPSHSSINFSPISSAPYAKRMERWNYEQLRAYIQNTWQLMIYAAERLKELYAEEEEEIETVN